MTLRPHKSLSDYLHSLGWEEKYLSWDGMYARINLVEGRPVFEPYSRWQGVLTSKTLPLDQVIHPGIKVRFLRSLKHQKFTLKTVMSGFPFTSRGWLVLPIRVFFSLLRLKPTEITFKRCIGDDLLRPEEDIEDYITMHGNDNQKPFDEFPFDEDMTVKGVMPRSADYQESDGTVWNISHVALVYVTQVEIFCDPASG